MKDKMRQFLQRQFEKGADLIMENVEQDQKMQEVKAPDSIHENLFQQIREHEEEAAYEKLSDENKELIRLGKIYKRRRKRNKYMILAATLVMVLAFGMISTGESEKVFKRIKWTLNENEQVNIDSDDERVQPMGVVDEVEAYQQIEDEYGFYPVRVNYLPENFAFDEFIMIPEMQNIQLTYTDENDGAIAYTMYPNCRVGSMGLNTEDTLLQEYVQQSGEHEIIVRKYFADENQEERWSVEFEHQNVYYFLRMYNLEEQEVNKIIENLHF